MRILWRFKLIAVLAACACLLTNVAHSAEEHIVGYAFPLNSEEAEQALAFCTRNGERVDTIEGTPVYAGSVLSTLAGGAVAVVFLDGSAVHLAESSSLKIETYEFPAKLKPTEVVLETGTAYFSINPRPEEGHFFIRSAAGRIEVKGTAFSVYVNSDASGSVKSTVAVKEGSVAVQPNGSSAVDLLRPGEKALMTIYSTKIAGGTTQLLNKNNLSKAELSALKTNLLEKVTVNVGKSNVVKVKFEFHNADGGKNIVSAVEIDGKIVNAHSTIFDEQGKHVETGKIALNGVQTITRSDPGGNRFVTVLKPVKNGTVTEYVGTATVFRDHKIYRGTSTLDAKGMLIVDAIGKKDGLRVVFTERLLPDGSVERQTATFGKGASEGGLSTLIKYPDGSTKTILETVTNNVNKDGSFNRVPGTAKNESTTPPLRNGETVPIITVGPITPVGGTVLIPAVTP